MPTRNAAGQRRRVTVAQSIVRRVQRQQSGLATAYGKTETERDRLSVLYGALQSASAPGAHQHNPTAADREVERANQALKKAVRRLHQLQRDHAQRVLTNETTRQSRKGV